MLHQFDLTVPLSAQDQARFSHKLRRNTTEDAFAKKKYALTELDFPRGSVVVVRCLTYDIPGTGKNLCPQYYYRYIRWVTPRSI